MSSKQKWHGIKTRTSLWCVLVWRLGSFFCEGIFHSSFGLMKYPYTKTIHLDLQTRIHHSLVLVILFSTIWNMQGDTHVHPWILAWSIYHAYFSENILMKFYLLCRVGIFALLSRHQAYGGQSQMDYDRLDGLALVLTASTMYWPCCLCLAPVLTGALVNKGLLICGWQW